MFQLVFRYIKQKKWLYLLIIATLIIYDVTLVIPTKLIQQVIDKMSHQQLTTTELTRTILLLLLVAVISYISSYIWHFYLFRSSVDFRFGIQKKAFQKLLMMRTPFYEKFKSGDVMTRFTTDSEGLKEMVGYGLMIVFFSGGMLLFVIPVMFLISWQISIMAILPIMCLGIVVYLLGKKQDTVVEANREAIAGLNDEVLEVVEGIRVTRAYGKKELQLKKFQQKVNDLAKKGDDIMRYQSLYGPTFFFFVAVSTTIILFMGATAIQNNQLSLGQVIALQLYTMSLIEPFWSLSDFILVYQVGKTSFEKIHELLETGDDLEEDGTIILQIPEEIQFSNYSFTYPGSSQVSLSDINLVIRRGDTIGIVGKTGSGKTTLVRQFLRQYPLGKGIFEINHQSVFSYQKKSIEAAIGYVPQEHILFSKSVEENIAIGKTNATLAEISSAVKTAAFTEDLKRMSYGLSTEIGEKGVSISGGQKQRISIARAFLKNPEILILDDSLSAVDAKTEQEIIRNIQTERNGKTTIIVSHRLSAVNHADWVIVLDEGRIIEAGKPIDLVARGGWYYEQYQRQQTKEED
ncbi:ABC transporter ATP-binding protein [Streptococcus marimammalium]|uniref:ABC transporter ATP-binding protein n=1 Tax=Streptococcus marimammalium TaxID=269666 RepID=UPI00037EDA90|nr:ABC transporter ATP-binding protein [Streptococcus marimammalium]